MVVTEPPPDTTQAVISDAVGGAPVQLRDFRVGHDGWARDALAILPPSGAEVGGALGAEDVAADAAVLRLYRALFGTDAEAQVFPIEDAGEEPPLRDLDWTVEPQTLLAWVDGAGVAWRRESDGQLVEGTVLLGAGGDGLYRRDDAGLVAWVSRRGADLCDAKASLRGFAATSDLLLGAIEAGGSMVVVGRERVASPLALTPLRTESLLRIAALRSRWQRRTIEHLRKEPGVPSPALELGQSFQRNNLFSGKLHDDSDWAPIYLSDGLSDTEFGGELCIADQLLKSWSLNGKVSYDNFLYRIRCTDPVW